MKQDPMPLNRLLSAGRVPISLGYISAFVGLEFATNLPGFSDLGITPWSPSQGLAFALILLFGMGFTPLVLAAPFIADALIRNLSLPWWIELVEVLLTSSMYLLAMWLLVRPGAQFNRALASMRDMVLLSLVVVAAAAVVALAYVLVLFGTGLLEAGDILPSMLRYWAGDVIGILLVTPFLLILATQRLRFRPTFESGMQVLAILLAVLIVLSADADYQQQLMYVLFLPIIWIAMRTGLAGVTGGLVLMQIGLMVGLHVTSASPAQVSTFQAALMSLVLAGLAIGSLISERERAEMRARQQQSAMARAGRIASLGSFSTSIAHEINQPLTAVGNYTRVILKCLESKPPSLSEAKGAATKAVAQVERAAEVIRRLRGLLQSGRVELSPCSPAEILKETAGLLAPECAEVHAIVETDVARGLSLVLADRLQIEQVIVNLVRNSLEAMVGVPEESRRVLLSVKPAGADRVEFAVSDHGGGFPQDFDLDKIGPGQTEKATGMGMGLVLCTSIIEAHGGKLVAETAAGGGATVRFQLAAARGGSNVSDG